MTDTSPATEVFLQAVKNLEYARTTRSALHEYALLRFTRALVEAVIEKKPRARIPTITSEAGSALTDARVIEAWAKKHLGADAIRQVSKPVGGEYDKALGVLTKQERLAKSIIKEAAPEVVLIAVHDTHNIVYESDITTYNTQGFGASTYAQFPAELIAEVLRRRGFEARVLPPDPHVFQVETDAPLQVKYLLPHWRLDDATIHRLSREHGSVNLKVYHHELSNDWDVRTSTDVETRDSESFAAMRVNEDAHLEVNKLLPAPPSAAPAPVPTAG